MTTDQHEVATLSTSTLDDALKAAKSRAEALRRQVAELEREAQRAASEEKLLAELVALRRGNPPTKVGSGASKNLHLLDFPATRGAPSSGAALPQKISSHAVVDEALNLLESESRPFHISEIMSWLQERQTELPGAGRQANVISHLRRDARINRPRRGLYALTAWGFEEQQPKPKSRKRRRRKSTRN